MTGRPRSFDQDAALLLSMERFWQNGYERTTIGDLTATLGITAPSLYAAFGDKDTLFASAAAHYVASVTAQMDKTLSQPNVRDGLAELFRVTVESYTDEKTPPGCFLLSEPRLADERRTLTARLAGHLRRGIDDGFLDASTDADALAEFTIAVIAGMSTRARDGGSAAEVRAIADVALAAVDAHAI
ncbi:TetR/AcrR family transcriptional regulator [Microbacterium sp. MPKO10]|uniref:TetR/AcrR family transcriptional regulator n=1 Tax=Microbacterium sp. MPKO10 TaxID=2989818 RepID=UPI002236509D|nr:TetR/AcrR family transcriptional regulator [Microbacterium sp. MPKO10]MCW4456857.1 TetR/AcrR family transcriptional regulator [Microbacterium sp. MPKO10]